MAYNISNTVKTPTYSSLSNKTGSIGYTSPMGGTSPANQALNNKATIGQSTQAPTWQSTLNSVMSNWKPTAPIKKVVQSNADGSSTETHFDNNTKTDPLIKPNLAGGGLTPEEKAAGDAYTTKLNSGTDNSNLTGGAALPSNAPLIDPTFAGMTTGASTLAQGNLPIGANAAQIAQNYGNQIAQVGQEGQNLATGYLSGGSSAPVATGAAGLAYNNATGRMSALSSAEQAALQGTGQQLTAQNQAQTGVLGAANLAQQDVAPGSTVYDTTTGKPIAGGIGGLTSYNAFQNFSSIQSSYPDANIQYDDTLTPQQNLANAQQQVKSSPTYQKSLITSGINPGGGNTLSSVAKNQSNMAGLGTTNQAYSDLSRLVNNVGDFGKLALDTGEGNNINPMDLTYGNKTISAFRDGLSSLGQKAFDSSLASFQASASQLIASGTGGTPTFNSDIVNKLSDYSTSMGALQSLVTNAKLEGATKLGNQASQIINYNASLNGQAQPNLPGTYNVKGTTYVLGTDGTYNPI